MSTKLDQIAAKAKAQPKLRFTSLAHLLTPDFLAETWMQMNVPVRNFVCEPLPAGEHGAWQSHPKYSKNC